MPPLIVAGALTAAGATTLAGGAAAGATIYASRKQGQSAKRAQSIQSTSDDAALQFERERDLEAKRQFDAQQQFEAQKWQAQEEQRLHDRQLADQLEARRGPYRAASQAALGRLGEMLGLNFDQGNAPGILGPVAPAGTGAPAPPSLPPQSQLLSSPMLGGEQGMSAARPFDATQPGYAQVNPMTAGSLLGLRRRPSAQRYA